MKKEYLKFKKYAHFDKKISVVKARKQVLNDGNISKHGFFPFIHYQKKNKKLEKVDNKTYTKKEQKVRDIYYCAHSDRYIYQQYAHELGEKYNKYMLNENIDDCSGAYRINRGKCNIDFSYDVFEFIKNNPNSIIIVGDFTSFFDNLNHFNLKRRIEKVIGRKIDNNLYKVYKSITRFKYIDLEDIYAYLTHRNGKRSEKYYLRKLNRIMSIEEFREFVNGANYKTGTRNLKINEKDYGIVQGSPLSGIFANIYMIDFDKHMNELANQYNGKYLRYSDDFIIVLNNLSKTKIKDVYKTIQQYIIQAGQIELKDEKTNVYEYKDKKIKCLNEEIFKTENKPNIINFLGFSFDGMHINIRQKTITKYYYKMYRKIKRYKEGKNDISLKDIYNKFTPRGIKKGNGNFHSYTKRAAKIFKEENIIKIRTNSKKKINDRLGKLSAIKN